MERKRDRKSRRRRRRREPLTFETCLILSRNNSRGLLVCGSLTCPRQTREWRLRSQVTCPQTTQARKKELFSSEAQYALISMLCAHMDNPQNEKKKKV